jgi:hypothetical protein
MIPKRLSPLARLGQEKLSLTLYLAPSILLQKLELGHRVWQGSTGLEDGDLEGVRTNARYAFGNRKKDYNRRLLNYLDHGGSPFKKQ